MQHDNRSRTLASGRSRSPVELDEIAIDREAEASSHARRLRGRLTEPPEDVVFATTTSATCAGDSGAENLESHRDP